MSSTALGGAVELLDRSLAYLRGALAQVRAEHLGVATPCRGWPLAVLLLHMDDALNAYTEASSGRVAATPAAIEPPLAAIASIRDRACGLLGWWLEHPPEEVEVADRRVPAQTLVAAAALEITLHGWDLHNTLGRPVDIPAELAGPLLAIAWQLVGEEDRSGCFTPAVATAPGASDSRRLLAYLGRG